MENKRSKKIDKNMAIVATKKGRIVSLFIPMKTMIVTQKHFEKLFSGDYEIVNNQIK